MYLFANSRRLFVVLKYARTARRLIANGEIVEKSLMKN